MLRRVTVIVTLVAVSWSPMSLGCSSGGAAPEAPRAPARAAPRVAAPPAPDLAEAFIAYQPPVAAAVRDGFRPPVSEYGAGNRGLEYATTTGQPVWAAGDGRVVFAGAVAGTLAVSIQHADGLRTTYTHLGKVAVSTGARVARGQVIGSATDRVHFGARYGSAYLDPAGLFEAVGGPARLVPDLDPARRGQPPG